MKYKGLILILFLLITLANAQLTWTSMFQAPGPLCDGMTWDGVNLWITSETPARIYKIDKLGVAIDTILAPGSQPTGLTWDGTHLWVGSHGTRRIYKVDPATGTVITSFLAPGSSSNEGLAFDGTFLWNTNWNNDYIYKLDTLGAQQGQFPAPGTGSTGLTWDGTYLWESDQGLDSVYCIDPANGQVIRREPGPLDTVIQDLAFDGRCLWTCGYYSGTVYQSSQIIGIEEDRSKTSIASNQLMIYPNPCRTNLNLNYQLPKSAHVKIGIYDAAGTLIANWFDGQMAEGNNELKWIRVHSIPNGIYFLNIKTNDVSTTRRIILLE